MQQYGVIYSKNNMISQYISLVGFFFFFGFLLISLEFVKSFIIWIEIRDQGLQIGPCEALWVCYARYYCENKDDMKTLFVKPKPLLSGSQQNILLK